MHQRLQSDNDNGEGVESWVVDDVSMGGMGAQVSSVGSDWARIGAFLAMQPEGGSNWLVGVIRRYFRETESVGAVGIETLSKTPRAVMADSAGLQTEIVLLDPLIAGEVARVLLATTAWEESIPLLLRIGGQSAKLLPQGVIETGGECTVGRYAVEF
jgi:hypothetical protein